MFKFMIPSLGAQLHCYIPLIIVIIRACLLSLIELLPSIPSRPGRESFSCISFQIAANRFYVKNRIAMGERVALGGVVTLVGEPMFFHVRTLAILNH